MKNFLLIFSIACCILLAVWCNLNTYFIKENTKKIEVLELVAHRHTTDTIYVVYTVDTTYVTYKIQKQNIKKK